MWVFVGTFFGVYAGLFFNIKYLNAHLTLEQMVATGLLASIIAVTIFWAVKKWRSKP